MDTTEIMRQCDSCKESVSIDATKCPHCQSHQFTARSQVAIMLIFGIVGLPISYIALPVAWSYGFPNGAAEAIGVGLVWAVVLLGPLFLLIGFGAYAQRRKAIKQAQNSA